MSTTQQSPGKLERFTGLRWYSASVTFLFSFLAITSEPLLAAGIVLSAIDFLQRGQLLAHNPALAGAWSIAQGLAMEVSVGPVLKNTLQARSEKDRVKTWLYGVLAGFLFTVGGAMLFLQFTESIMGISEQSLPVIILISLFAFRTIASLGYIALACTKHVRFSGTVSVLPVPPLAQVEQQSSISDETLQLLLAKLAKLDELEQRFTAAPVSVSEVAVPPVPLLESSGTEDGTDEPEPALDERIKVLLAIKNDLSVREIAVIVARPSTTVHRTLKRLEQSTKSVEQLEQE